MTSSKKVPNVFIGSSAEKLNLVEALFLQLGSRELLATHWAQGTSFVKNNSALDSLVDVFNKYDFACFFIDADDVLLTRGNKRNVARDNIIFEIGLSIGKLGKERVFIIHDRNNKPDLPSDLQGIIFKEYEILNNDLKASMGHLGIEIKEEIRNLGILKNNESNKNNSEVCDADWLVINREGVTENQVTLDNSRDTSDLFFLFLNVSDCEDCRKKIEDIADEFNKDYFIDATYDLLGAWDVLVKFRTKQDAHVFESPLCQDSCRL